MCHYQTVHLYGTTKYRLLRQSKFAWNKDRLFRQFGTVKTWVIINVTMKSLQASSEQFPFNWKRNRWKKVNSSSKPSSLFQKRNLEGSKSLQQNVKVD